MSNKYKLDAYGIVNFVKSCNAIIQRKLLEKLKDLGSFTIPSVIGRTLGVWHYVTWVQALI